MNVTPDKIGAKGRRELDILCFKVQDRMYHDMLLQEPGYGPAYHMNRLHWLAVRLDGSVPLKEVCSRLGESYLATLARQKKKAFRGPKEWLVPANAHYYDPLKFFDGKDEMMYKQGSDIRVGDTVYIYAGLPIGAVLYRCKATEVDIPANEVDQYQIRTTHRMRLHLEERYPTNQFTRALMKEEYGVYSVRSPRSVPYGLSLALRHKEE